MKKILQNLNYAAPYPGNLMRSLWALENKCRGKYSVVYLFPKVAEDLYWVKEMINKGHAVYFKADDKSDFAEVIKSIVDKCGISIIHTHFYSNIEYKIMHKILGTEVKFVLHHHNHFMDTKTLVGKNLIKNYLKNLYIRIHRISIKHTIDIGVNIACGIDVEKDLISKRFKNVFCVENAIDFTRLDYVSQLNRKDVGISEKDIVLLIFGFAFERKGVDLTIKAVETLAEKNDLKLCIVFSSNEEENRNKITNILGCIPNWIKFLSPNDNIAEYYNMSDIFLSPSREEGCCYSIIEAAYCGCDLIASDIPGQRHANDFPHKRMVKSGSVEALIDAIEEAIENPITRKELEENRNYLIKRYSLDRWCEKIIDIYNDLL